VRLQLLDERHALNQTAAAWQVRRAAAHWDCVQSELQRRGQDRFGRRKVGAVCLL